MSGRFFPSTSSHTSKQYMDPPLARAWGRGLRTQRHQVVLNFQPHLCSATAVRQLLNADTEPQFHSAGAASTAESWQPGGLRTHFSSLRVKEQQKSGHLLSFQSENPPDPTTAFRTGPPPHTLHQLCFRSWESNTPVCFQPLQSYPNTIWKDLTLMPPSSPKGHLTPLTRYTALKLEVGGGQLPS